MRKLIISIFAMLCIMPVCGRVSEIEDSLNRVLSEAPIPTRLLSEATMPADSLHIMCNLFDLAQLRNHVRADSIARKIMIMAHRNGNRAVEIEMIRQRANINSWSIDSLNRLLDMAESMPLSPERDETEALIKMLQNSYYARHASPDERKARLKASLAGGSDDTTTLYGKIVAVHNICVNVSKLSHGDLLMKYENKLHDLIEQLPENCRSLKSVYYVQAALDMSQAGVYDEMMKVNRRLLEVIDSLEDYYHGRGRVFRNYDATRYLCYTRILSNWNRMTDDEIKECYDSIMAIVARDPRAEVTYRSMPIPDIHIAMWQKDYAKAVPLLKRTLSSPGKVIFRDQILRFAIEASRATGDKELLLSSMEEYVPMLEKRVDDISEEKYNELQLVQDVQNQARSSVERKLLHTTDEYKILIKIVISAILVAVVLLVFLIIYIRKYRHANSDKAKCSGKIEACADRIAELDAEVSRLNDADVAADKLNDFKSNFIRNLNYEIETPVEQIVTYSRLIVDGVDEMVRPFVEEYVAKIEQNSTMLLTTFNDMIQVYELESDQAIVDMGTVNLVKVVNTAMDVMSPLAIANSVILEAALPDKDIVVTTDARRYQQIVQNLLRDSVLRSMGGVVKISLETDENEVRLLVCGDEPIEQEVLQNDNTGKRSIMLLSVSRMLARLIGAQLYITGPGRMKNTIVLALKIA